MLTANVAGSDLAGTVEAARDAVAAAIELPPGYSVTFSGQFEEAIRSQRHLAIVAALILVLMYGLLFLAFRSHRHTLIVLVNLPLALIGGIFAVKLSDGVLSVATLVGFVTLFGIATRNGVLLVNRYQQLMRDGIEMLEAIRQGSRERQADPDDRVDRRSRAPAAGGGGTRGGQRDPEPDGAGHLGGGEAHAWTLRVLRAILLH